MRALLDTHVFVWATSDERRLSDVARTILADGENEIFLSAVTAWEIAIKHAKGRLDLKDAPETYVPDRMELFGFRSLSVEVGHALRAGALPPVHRDPFDRLLIAQSQLERLPILTSDPNIGRYDVEVIW